MNRKVAVPLRQGVLELGTRGDVELGEDLAQVVPGRATADVEAGADLGVGQPVAGELGDLDLLGRQFAVAADTALSCSSFTGRPQFSPGALGEAFHPHRLEHVEGCAQLVPGVARTALAAQPFSVQEVGAGELGAHPGTAKVLNRRFVELLSLLAIGQQRSRPRLQAQCTVACRGDGNIGETAIGISG